MELLREKLQGPKLPSVLVTHNVVSWVDTTALVKCNMKIPIASWQSAAEFPGFILAPLSQISLAEGPMSSIFSQTPQGSVCSEPAILCRHQLQVSLLHNFRPDGFSNLPVFLLQKWDAWDLILYILREEGTLLFNHPTGCQGSNQYRLTQGQIQCWQGGSVEHFNREALENWKMIQHFQGGGKEFESD